MNGTRTPAGVAHYDPRLTELSTLPASNGRSSRAYTRTLSSTEAPMMFLACPAYLDPDGPLRCGLPAEVRYRFTMRSTDGPLEAVMIRCPAGHCFNGLIESLSLDSTDNHEPDPAGASSRARRDSLQHGHDDRARPILSYVPVEPERKGRRPNTAPAYYLGHPAALWITAMRPRRQCSASRYLMEAAVSGGNPDLGRRNASAQLTSG